MPPLLLMGSLGAHAVGDVDSAFDTWGYHLPFASRLVGFTDASSYGFERLKEERYRGFPLLGELAQGALWKVTGRVQSANLVAFGSLVAFVVFLRRRLEVPFWLGVPALVAIPMIQIHATSCYVDLPAGVAIAVALLSVYRLWDREGAVDGWDLALAGIGIAAAVNLKHLMVPLGGATFLAAGGLAFARADGAARRRVLAAWLLCAPLLFATPVRNLMMFGNPIYPIELRLGSMELPATESRATSDLLTDSWRDIPRPARFVLSALEVGAYDSLRPVPWVIDMGDVEPGSRPDRIGGYFFPNVLLHSGVLLIAALAAGASGRRALILFGAVTACAALQPQSQQMRFSLYWVLVLVGLGCHLAVRRERRRAPGARALAVPLAFFCWALVATVVIATRGIFLLPQGNSLANHLGSHTDRRLLERVSKPPGACLLAAQPNTFLYAPLFHGGTRYRLKAAYDESECGNLRVVYPDQIESPPNSSR